MKGKFYLQEREEIQNIIETKCGDIIMKIYVIFTKHFLSQNKILKILKIIKKRKRRNLTVSQRYVAFEEEEQQQKKKRGEFIYIQLQSFPKTKIKIFTIHNFIEFLFN